MIEVYKNTDSRIYLSIDVAGVLTDADDDVVVSIKDKSNVIVNTPEPATNYDIGKYYFDIPFDITANQNLFKVDWEFQIGGTDKLRITEFNVVTPYVIPEEVRLRYPEHSSKTDEELKEIEREVRTIIDSITGQSFGTWHDTYKIRGLNESFINLPYRMYTVDTVTVNGYNLLSYGIELSPEYQSVRYTNLGTNYDIKADVSLWSSSFFKRDYVYEITGYFGWESVPSEINLAAKMLINDYLCKENLWRRKGLKNIRAADWRIEFDSSNGTGNKDVDKILADFTNPIVLII